MSYAWYALDMGKTRTGRAKSILGRQYKIAAARANFSAVMAAAERGEFPVVRRADVPVVLIRRDDLDATLESAAPFEPVTSIHNGQVSIWLEAVPVHGNGANYADAEDDFLDALIDYAELWYAELRYAPNHKQNGELVRRIAMYAERRDELREVVFAED